MPGARLPRSPARTSSVLATSGLALVIYALIGVGIGALVRNQVGAIVGGLVYLFVVEGLIRSIPATSGAYKWMPGGALEAMTATFQGPDLLGAWQGGLLLVGYGLRRRPARHAVRRPARRRLIGAHGPTGNEDRA